MTSFEPKHVSHSGTFSLPLTVSEAFPLFTAEGERRWVPGWDPVYLHPRHPSNEPGTVFRTTHGGDDTIWIVLTHDPIAGVAEYARVAPSSRAGTVSVRCRAIDERTTDVQVSYALTSLTSAGTTTLEALTPSAYHRMLEEWRGLIIAGLGLSSSGAT
jgi:hypothetical protein